MAGFQQKVELRMEHGLTQNMQVDVLRVSFDFPENFRKVISLHEGPGTVAFMAETAGEVTTVGHLDIDLLENIHYIMQGQKGLKREAIRTENDMKSSCRQGQSPFTAPVSLAQEKRLAKLANLRHSACNPLYTNYID